MRLAWVAGSVRASLLASRRIGRQQARALAGSGSLAAALGALAETPYGHQLTPSLSLEAAQRAIAASTLWHLRVLGGWVPPAGAELLRALAAWFEIANVQDRLAYFAGEPFRQPYELGLLATAWRRLAQTSGPEDLRRTLAASFWGDPGSSDPTEILEAMRAVWAGRLAYAAPEASGWVRAAAVLLLSRPALMGSYSGQPRAALARLAGLRSGWEGARRPADLQPALPSDISWVLAGIEAADELWQAEARWWSRVEVDAVRLARQQLRGRAVVVGVVALLAADAWRLRAALEAAARGGAATEAFDAVA